MNDYNNRLTRLEHKRPADHMTEQHRQAIIDAAYGLDSTAEERAQVDAEIMRDVELHRKKYSKPQPQTARKTDEQN
jgi:hypothetical protein